MKAIPLDAAYLAIGVALGTAITGTAMGPAGNGWPFLFLPVVIGLIALTVVRVVEGTTNG